MAASSDLDIVDEAGEWRCTADEEGEDGTPVTSKLLGVAIDTVKVVHVWYRHSAVADDVVVAYKD